MNVMFIASEASPLAKTGGLGDVVGALPHALRTYKHHLTVVMPYYRQHIDALEHNVKPARKTIHIWADGVERGCSIHRLTLNGVSFLLVEQDDLFDREGLYGPAGSEYDDNLLRFLLFNRVALELAAQSGKNMDMLHCHDWQTAMIPLLLQSQYRHLPRLAKTKTLFTIHNLAYQGIFPASWMGRLGIPTHHFHPGGIEFHGQINCMKAGIMMADAITTVSPGYAQEILTSEYGCQLEGFLSHYQSKLSGIVNGIDTNEWNPASDPWIEAQYSCEKKSSKSECKALLQKICGLIVNEEKPLLTMVSRLADQKGVDLILPNIEKWVKRGYQMVFLGSGDPDIEDALARFASKHPRQIRFWQGFNEKLAHQIYAGGDIFLMPSRFEPCGLGQLIAMRYGNVPVVRSTGGLNDTVVDYNTSKNTATGVHFSDLSAKALDKALEQTIDLYRQPRVWSRIRSNALKRDSSWDRSALEYSDLYTSLVKA